MTTYVLPMIIEELKAPNQKMVKLYNLEHVEHRCHTYKDFHLYEITTFKDKIRVNDRWLSICHLNTQREETAEVLSEKSLL